VSKLWLVPVLFILVILAIFSSTPPRLRADFTYVNPSGIHTLDPARMSWTQDFRIALNIWEGLTTRHAKTTEPVEGAAIFPPKVSEDGLTYTFTIRDDARWSNGEPVTAHDFLRGWRRGMEPGTATDYTYLFTQHIEGAGQYVRCRRDAVAILTAFRRLQDRRSITIEQAQQLVAIAESFAFGTLLGGAVIEASPPGAPCPDWKWSEFADRLRSGRSDWPRARDEFLDDHIAEAEVAFRQVGIDAVDDRTLVVQLVNPCPYFLDLTAFPIFLPIHVSIEQLRARFHGDPYTAEGLVVYDPQWTKPDYRAFGYPGLITNGPYIIDEWIFKRRLSLGPNPHHRDAPRLGCRTIDMVTYDNANAAIMAYEAGDVDFLPSMVVSYDHEIARLARYGERPDFRLCEVMATYFLNFNCTSTKVNGVPNPFVDRRVRKAFALAVDRERIVEQVLRRGDRLAHSFVPPNTIPGYTPPDGLSFDPVTGRALLAEAGYPDGVGLPPIEYLYTDRDVQAAQALANMWSRELGARIELRSLETKTFAEEKAAHRFMIARGNWYGDYNDPTTFLDCLATDNGNNDSGYANPDFDQSLHDAARTRDSAERFAILRRAETLLLEKDVPILPILHYAEPIAIKPYVRGLYPNRRVWVSFRDLTIER